MRRFPLIVICLAALAASAAPARAEETPTTYDWEGSGTPYEAPPRSRAGFFAAGGPQAGAFLNEIRRPAGGLSGRFGYGVTDRLLVSLETAWTLSRQFTVYYNFFDFFPRVDAFVWDDLYLVGEGGATLTGSSSGSTVTGFSPTGRVTRLGFAGGAGVGYVFITGSDLSLSGEALGLYRSIKGGNFFEPLLRVSLIWEF